MKVLEDIDVGPLESDARVVAALAKAGYQVARIRLAAAWLHERGIVKVDVYTPQISLN